MEEKTSHDLKKKGGRGKGGWSKKEGETVHIPKNKEQEPEENRGGL